MSFEQPNRVVEPRFPLEELSWTLAKNAIVISQYLEAHHLPQPSFNSKGPSVVVPTSSPQAIQEARQKLIAASLEIFHLAVGPSEFLPNLAAGFEYVSCLDWLCQYDIFHLVPLSSGINYTDLAAAAHVPEQRLKSIVRMAMTNSLFREQSHGSHVTHSATSALLARDNDVHAYATYMCARSAPMAMKMAAADRRWGHADRRPHETAHNIAFDTDLPFFQYLSQDKAMTDDFAGYMRNVRSSEGVDIKHLVNGFTWQDIPERGVVVDVGGSTGGAAIALAKAFPHLNLVVQDLPVNAESGRTTAAQTLPIELLKRITFQAHDFTHEQPVRGADVYLLRMILHDWPDAEAVEILRKTIAAMDNESSRLLIMDTVLPMPGSVPVSIERILRVRDLFMAQTFNSKERDLGDWKTLFATADPRLRLVGVIQPFGSAMSVLEMVVDPMATKENVDSVLTA